MGSLRNPIGPLPSTIYWRRRAVLLTVVGLLAILVVWIVTGGGGGGNNAGEPDGKNPVTSITPGPSAVYCNHLLAHENSLHIIFALS
ncbi:hypothetical protein PV378_43970, partial [Streptomyces scabiei]|nr:hypothetical protein [Streptomyces scabiei]